eukprot:7912160-Pyramimonas_sp.AAC.1
MTPTRLAVRTQVPRKPHYGEHLGLASPCFAKSRGSPSMGNTSGSRRHVLLLVHCSWPYTYAGKVDALTTVCVLSISGGLGHRRWRRGRCASAHSLRPTDILNGSWMHGQCVEEKEK